ncbi:Epoxide hydrolase [Kitasatospora sp. MMS16-BH015]|uniref:alpha/beta fold hydrolase n=1 Tax=Kitasatospora sp. MMS16-BH015 TaxID=2018025 RepID=UPI000CA2ABA2|nr:alpha/beta hydrolase [Kitasatospora sp. MMS16-BH015]AUG81147.1 Epoxide hydrolase [Kitasatospora sp. MMS16-BH015]
MTPSSRTEPTHRVVLSGATRIHLVEQGSGPLVLLVHGFPESWYSWRHQLPALAEAGYRAVAIDVRGYGRSSHPTELEAYRIGELAADCAAVVRALGAEEAVIIGHDWGSPIATAAALTEPELFRAVALLSVPYAPPGPARLTEALAPLAGEHEFYLSYFQEPGRAEREIEPDMRGWLAGAYHALAAEGMSTGKDPFAIPRGARMRDGFPTGPRPDWLTEDDLDFLAAEFERTGLTGGLNRYRCMDRDGEDLLPHHGAPLPQPSLFIGGTHDAPTRWFAELIADLGSTMPGLLGTHILEGCGHWIQQERPKETNQLLLDWLAQLDG